MINIGEYDTPWEVACALINAEVECKNPFTKITQMEKAFGPSDLLKISHHLTNYAVTEREEE